MTREIITDGQRRVLDFVRDFIGRWAFPPTRTEIARGLGFKSANAAEEHLAALGRKGYLKLHRGIARGISLTK